MKKFILLILILLITGCTVVRIDTSNIDTIVDVILSKENTLYNRIGNGYKYYVPRGVIYLDSDDLNDKLYSNGTYYYLYVDTISYGYNTAVEYTEKEDLYYSRKISQEDGFKWSGYLEIDKKEDFYYMTFAYNHAKIECVVNKDQIKDAVLNSAYILSTIQFNQDVINLRLNDEYFTNKEEKYDEFAKNEEGANNFELQVVDNED